MFLVWSIWVYRHYCLEFINISTLMFSKIVEIKFRFCWYLQGRSHFGDQRGHDSHTSIFQPEKLQQLQFEKFLLVLRNHMDQKFHDFQRVAYNVSTIYSDTYTEEIDHFSMDFLKISDTYRWIFWQVSDCGPSKRWPQWTSVKL